MLTREEYEKTYIRMMDSTRDTYKGDPNCNGVECDACHLRESCHNHSAKTFSAFKFVEAVEKWGKEHPIITYADKYKEVFGIDPTEYCPMDLIGGILSVEECEGLKCTECKSMYWNKEYKAPTKGE